MNYPDYCNLCGEKITPTLEGLLEHIRTEKHNYLVFLIHGGIAE